MADETRDRPAEIDFGPGALDHRISLEALTTHEAKEKHMPSKVDTNTVHVRVIVTWSDEKESTYSSALFLNDEGIFGADHQSGSLRMKFVTKERTPAA